MRCKCCGDRFEPKFFLQKFCMEKDECISAFTVFAKDVTAKKNAKEWRAEKSLLKEKLKSLADWKADLQKEINLIVRIIDFQWPCIATGATTGKVNAGHYIGTLANPTIRFHLENIWLQSEHSNTWKSGDTLRYQEGIVRLFGKDYLEYLNGLQSIPPIKLSVDEIKEKIFLARGIVKRLRLQDRKYSLAERLSLRKQFNKQLGIYQ